MSKSPDAFRTISEVADWLGIQAHVLRFWESKFSQVKPVKRAGGRRYYRPNDMLLLGGIRQLLHEDGLTIKGVQKILREEGVSHVAALSQPLDDAEEIEAVAEESPFIEAEPEAQTAGDNVVSFDGTQSTVESAKPEVSQEEQGEAAAAAETVTEKSPEPEIVEALEPEELSAMTEEPSASVEDDTAPEAMAGSDAESPAEETGEIEAADEMAEPASLEPEDSDDAAPEAAAPVTATLPAFLRRPMAPQSEDATDNAPADPEPAAPAPVAALRPRVIDMPTITPPHEMEVSPATLSAVYRTRKLTTAQARQIAPLLDRLTILRDSMAARRRPTTNPGAND